MPEFSTYIEIDPYEYVDECSKSEIKELIECLIEDGHLSKIATQVTTNDKKPSLLEEEFLIGLDKLSRKYYSLSQEDDEILKNLFLKYN